jgi:hypothetical protein
MRLLVFGHGLDGLVLYLQRLEGWFNQAMMMVTVSTITLFLLLSFKLLFRLETHQSSYCFVIFKVNTFAFCSVSIVLFVFLFQTRKSLHLTQPDDHHPHTGSPHPTAWSPNDVIRMYLPLASACLFASALCHLITVWRVAHGMDVNDDNVNNRVTFLFFKLAIGGFLACGMKKNLVFTMFVFFSTFS